MYDFSVVTFPTPLEDIIKFEKRNSVSINVYGVSCKTEDVFPLRISRFEEKEHFDLLLIDNEGGTKHYSHIKNLSRLLSAQVSKGKCSSVFCKMCLTHFKGSKKNKMLRDHVEKCKRNTPVKICLPHAQND